MSTQIGKGPRAHTRGRRLAATIGSLVISATLLTGCGPERSAPTLTWYINPDAGGQAELAKRCTEAANGEYFIETSLLPRDAAAQREQLARRLAAGDNSLDIMSIDPPFIPELALFLEPVPDGVAERTTENTLDGALAGAMWQDELVTVPFWANTQILWYRESVAEAANLDMSQPVTWNQIMEAAENQNKDLGVQGSPAESMTVWVNALIESAGGQILRNPGAPAEELQLGLTSEAGREAARIIGTIGDKGLGGPGLATSNENDSLTGFQTDDGSFMVNYPFVWPALNAAVEAGTLEQSVLDDVGWALFPRVYEDQPTAPPLGGINLGVGAESDHPELAYDAIECIVQPENQTYYFLTNGNPPSNSEAYEDPRIEEEFPMAPTIRESLELAAPRPQTEYYNEISSGIQQLWSPPVSVEPNVTPEESEEFILAVLRGEKLL
ncbi:extracellular solute-binding protein [Arthrobacter monumenti]